MSATLPRIQSLDLLKGLIIVIMALDHVRDYFHETALTLSPTDPATTNWLLFLSRWITHYCAPNFCLLAGISAFLSGRRKSKPELSWFLLTRGLWLVLLDLTLVNFGWYYDPAFHAIDLGVIWMLGICMMCLAALVYLPKSWLVGLGLLMVFGHNLLLDGVHLEKNVGWAVLHEPGVLPLWGFQVGIRYPLIPWIGLMALGYALGSFFTSATDANIRKKWLVRAGLIATGLFVLLRLHYVFFYLDALPYPTLSQNLMFALDACKYPPSLHFLLMTLGPALFFLGFAEQAKGRFVAFLQTFGRVPFFFYLLHIYLIHTLAMLAAALTGFGAGSMVMEDVNLANPKLDGYGFPLWVVCLIWLLVVALLYFPCKWYDAYKMSHRENKWLGYL